MLLGISYDEVEKAFGGNIDPSKSKEQEANRVYVSLRALLEGHNCGILELFAVPTIVEGRRYWVSIRINDATNPFSEIMTHSIVVDEGGRVFDPNPQYGEFNSLEEWGAAMILPHQVESVTEIFRYSF